MFHNVLKAIRFVTYMNQKVSFMDMGIYLEYCGYNVCLVCGSRSATFVKFIQRSLFSRRLRTKMFSFLC